MFLLFDRLNEQKRVRPDGIIFRVTFQIKGPQPKLEALVFAPKARFARRAVLVHAVHAAAVSAAGRGRLGLRNLDDECFGGEQQTSD